MDERIENTLAHFRQAHVDGGPHLFRPETAFLSFVCTLCAVEALAGYRFGNTTAGAGERFRAFVTSYFPAVYHQHAARLCDFRNGMIHAFTPRRMSIIRGAPAIHLHVDETGTPTLNADDFFAAMLTAANAYVAEPAASEELQTAFLHRLESAAGGGIHVAVLRFEHVDMPDEDA